MPLPATIPGGNLSEIDNCYISVKGQKVTFRILPEISDSRTAHYNDEPVIGRSFPIKTFSHGENRSISWKCHFIVLNDGDADTNLASLRLLQSATYPEDAGDTIYLPPPICKIKCGDMLSKEELCAILTQYQVSFPTDVALDEATMCPWRFDVDLTFQVVYASAQLPGSDKIMNDSSGSFGNR